LPNDENHDSQADRHPQDGGEIPETSLESAIDFIGRNAGTTCEEPFERRQRIAVLQLNALHQWGRNNSFLLEESIWEKEARIGGSEHDVWERGNQMWKITRPDRFGWTVLPGDNGSPEVAEATPLEYLVRWQISNRTFGDTVRLMGIYCSDEGTQVVVSQRFLAGIYPNSFQIREELVNFGFSPVRTFSVGAYGDSSFFNPELGIALFDAARDNFITLNGIPVPVDLLPVKAGSKLRAQLLKLMG